MNRFFSIAAILALLIQGTAWAAMPMPMDAMMEATAIVKASEAVPDDVSSVATDTDRPLPCPTHGADDPYAEPIHHGGDSSATEICDAECGCASFCAGVLGAPVNGIAEHPHPAAGTCVAHCGHCARQPDNPYRPPIANLR